MSPRASSTRAPTEAHGFSSALPQTANATRPPGRNTRRVSARATAGSGISM